MNDDLTERLAVEDAATELARQTDRLVAAAESGCGLWIGLHAEANPIHDELRRAVDVANPGVLTPAEGAHVTLAHLGRRNGRHAVEAAIAAASLWILPKEVSVECLARFANHVVAIVVPHALDHTADMVASILDARSVRIDRSFAGIRHVTVAAIRRGVELVALPRAPKYALRFTSIAVTCGEAEVRFSLPTGQG